MSLKQQYNSTEIIQPSFTPEDIRQFIYCPRIIYHRYVLRLARKKTYKMKRGIDDHERWKKRQIHRGTDTDRYFGIYLSNEEVGLIGVLDAIDYDGTSATPIELKTGKPPTNCIYPHHAAQILAQCFLVESCLKAHVTEGIVHYQKEKKEMRVSFNDCKRIFITDTLQQMRDIVLLEDIPERTEHLSKCVDCEFAAFCI